MVFLSLLIAILLLLVIILLSHAKLFLKLTFDGKVYSCILKIRALFGLVRLQKEFPVEHKNISEKNESGPHFSEDTENVTTETRKVSDSIYETNRDLPKYDKEFKKAEPELTEKEALTPLQDTKALLENARPFLQIIRALLKKVKIKSFVWKTVIGTGDAATTGISSGAGYAIKGNVLGIISHYMNLTTRPIIIVEPDFQKRKVRTDLKCMIQVRVGNAILAGIKLFLYWRRMKRMVRGTLNKESKQTLSEG